MINKIEVDQLNFYYSGKQALSGINLNIPDRQITALIGPSGCGKSTFLRCLNRMNNTIAGTRTEGSILLKGEKIFTAQCGRSAPASGHGFSKAQPVSTIDLRQCGLRAARLKKSGSLDHLIEQRLRDAALWEDVKDKIKCSALELSLGEQQRLCIARVLAVTPAVILMDEPAAR